MPNLDTALRKVSKTILDGFGTTVTYRRVLTGEYNATTGAPIRTEVDKNIKGRLVDYTAREFNETVLVGDKKLIVAASDLAFNPEPEHEVDIDQKTYRVVRVESPQATDQAALHVIQLRGA